MSSHHKHGNGSVGKTYLYRIVTSSQLKKHDAAAIEEHLNTLGSEGWDLVTIDMKDSAKGISFLGLMKRKVYREHKR